ncbi:hypothetical protein GCM10010531_05060 [Blastococcus jejuensis]|uniref:Big-1 domain-containing protein n=1 Tax=Blastococcus jejuensis TaxID=351224 RepID=A0ABP6NS22_9ACTN
MKRSVRSVLALLPATFLVATALAVPAAAAEGPYDPFFAAPATVADFGASARPFGVAAGDFDEDGDVDLVIGRTTGNVALARGNGDGTFAAPVAFAWKQAFFNAWAFAPADVDGDGNLDVVWGASAVSSGCSVPGTGCVVDTTVNDGDVRVWYGNGDGTFDETAYFVSGVRHNAGTLLADIGTDAGSLAATDIDGDGDTDVVAGEANGTTGTVKVLRNGGGTVAVETLDTSGTYFPAISTQNSPWGLATGDADGDGDTDLWVGDRALYVYLYRNDGAGAFTVVPGNIPGLETRPNVYLRHDSYRPAVGYTPSLASADVNGDGRADLFVGLHSGAQTPASGVANDGAVLLDVSDGTAHTGFGPIADLGTMTRGLQAADVNGDGATDLVGAVYEGQVKLLRQLAPRDTDGDGISDYVDNAPGVANAPRIDMNTDGSVNYLDQLDNDFDTVLGDPENEATWQRLGDAVDPDDDNDGVGDAGDNCAYAANPGQADGDADGRGDACDPLADTDTDGDGVPDGPAPGDPLYEAARAAAAKWSEGDTHFVIRIDALGRLFQNEFTQILTDAATLTPEEWATKCWENYQPDDGAYEPCGADPSQPPTLAGGMGVPVTLITIPKQLWTDVPVVDWINDRNDNPLFELGLHATYHVNNVPVSDWADLEDRWFYSCETCGLTLAENLELLAVGRDTLLGDYGNPWVAQSGATASSPAIDWSSSANPLISYAPPFNADDTAAREALSMLGFRAHSSSVFEENSSIFTPEGSHHEGFDQFGLFHASADLELDPPDTTGDDYDRAAYEQYLQANTDDGGLTTWLIEEVEWSGRPCQNDDRLGTCNGGSNRENNTVYAPRWEAWLQMLDFVRNYPGGVAMTMGEVALARSFDNAPTVPNPDQADSDHDGIGDVIDDVSLTADEVTLSRNVAGMLSATLAGGGNGIAGQTVTFAFDADGDGTAETYHGVTDATGEATVSVTATRPVGTAAVTVTWSDGRDGTATDTAEITVSDATDLTLAATPTGARITDAVTVSATLVDSEGTPLPGRTVEFSLGSVTGSGTTDASGIASASLVPAGPQGLQSLSAHFAGEATYGASSDSRSIPVSREDTVLTATYGAGRITATLREDDGAGIAGETITFSLEQKVKGRTQLVEIGSAQTDAAGVATFAVPPRYLGGRGTQVTVSYAGDAAYLPSSTTVLARR